MRRIPMFLLGVILAVSAWSSATAQATRTNAPPAGSQPIQGLIQITDSGWTTGTGSSDCVTGAADDTWQLTLTQVKELTVTVTDCCCPGDYFEIFVDGEKIGTTANLAPPWGCDFSGPLSSGSFKKVLCPGVHTITVRDAGFDGHSQTEIADQNMCPAGFTVSGSLAAPPPPPEEDVTAPSLADLGPAAPPSPEAQALMNQMAAVESFVSTDERGFQKLDTQGARRAGVAQEAVVLGHRIVALNNRIIAAAHAGKETPLERRDFDFIEPLFLYQAQTGHPCTDRQNPAPCPARVESGRFFPSEQEVRQHLESLGYHQTAGYAGGGTGRDFTIVVSYPGCGTNGAFRNQAIYRQDGACWTYNTQGPEPNPEFLSYIPWPYFSWVGYVRWWHLTFC
jgi:hypothetical protein